MSKRLKERTLEIPVWVKDLSAQNSETPEKFAKGILSDKYGDSGSPVAIKTGPVSEYSKIKKCLERKGAASGTRET